MQIPASQVSDRPQTTTTTSTSISINNLSENNDNREQYYTSDYYVKKKSSFRTQSMKMTLSALNPYKCVKLARDLRQNLSTSGKQHPGIHGDTLPTMDDSSLSSMEFSATKSKTNKQNKQNNKNNNNNDTRNVKTLDLFKYASLRERLALGVGVVCMLYAASWQPISVFILATMANLMGQYSRQLELLNEMSCQGPEANNNQDPSENIISPLLVERARGPEQFDIGEKKYNNSNTNNQSSERPYVPAPPASNFLFNFLNDMLNLNENDTSRSLEPGRATSGQTSTAQHDLFMHYSNGGATTNYDGRLQVHRPPLNQRNQSSISNDELARSTLASLISGHNHGSNNGSRLLRSSGTFEPSSGDGSGLPLLEPISRFITPLLWPTQTEAYSKEDAKIESSVGQLIELEGRQFLRTSFELNGSAFMLAQTQLISFFLGISLIAWAARQQASRVKCLFFKSCLQQELNWFESRPDDAAGLGSSLNSLVAKYEDGIGIKLALLIYFIGHIVLFAIVAFCEMANLAAFCMPFVLLVWLAIVYLSDLQSVAIGESSMFAKRSLQLAEEIIMSIRTVFAFNGQQREFNRFEQVQEPAYKKSLAKHFYTALNTSLSKFSIFACFSLYCFYAARLFPPHTPGDGPQNRPSVLAVMRGAEVSIVNILISIPFMEALQQSRGCIACIYKIIERKSRIDPTAAAGAAPVHEETASLDTEQWDGSVSLKQVHFSYSSRPQLAHFQRKASRKRRPADHPKQMVQPEGGVAKGSGPKGLAKFVGKSNLAGESELAHNVNALSNVDRDTLLGSQQRILSGLTFDVSAQQSVALVGPSGSGKSTVLALVQRLYDVNEGCVMVGQRDIRSVSPAWLRNQIGIVTQEPRLFDLTIGENIRLGLSRQQASEWDESFIQQQVIEAAKQSGAHEFITKLPLSYETRVGSGGVQLSGGQKQRIAIARALIRRPKLLLLDECTSALDSESEAQVQMALRAASSGKTTLTVAHHLTTVKHCDLIVVMERGRVVERGSHKELMNNFGLYRRLWDKQLRQRNVSDTTMSEPGLVDSSASGGESSSTGKPDEIEASHESESSSSTPTSSSGSIDLGQPSNCAGYTQLISSAMDKLKSKSSKPGPPPGGWREDAPPPPPGFVPNQKEFKEQKVAKNSFEEEEEDGLAELQVNNLVRDKPRSRFQVPAIEPTLGDRKVSTSSTEISFDSAELNNPQNIDDDDQKFYESQFNAKRVKLSQLWKFIEMPTWASCLGTLACLLAGLILPISLIAHSYLFAAFAYKPAEELGHYIHSFGLWVLSFSGLVFVISFAQIILPGYVGERLSKRMRCKIMQSLLIKPIFYFDLQRNSAGALVDRFNGSISNIQSIAGTRLATLLEACSTLLASGLFGFAQSPSLSLFCLSFALFVLLTTMLESRLMQLECERERQFDVMAANLMADALSNIKTITSLNSESFFIRRFSNIMANRKQSHARSLVYLRTFLTSLKFVMPAMSWSASMYFGSVLLVDGKIDLQTVFIVCPVVLFAVNDTFRALVFLPELFKAQESIKKLYGMHEEFSPQALKKLTLAEQLLEQTAVVAASSAVANEEALRNANANGSGSSSNKDAESGDEDSTTKRRPSRTPSIFTLSGNKKTETPARVSICANSNRRLSTLGTLPNYMNVTRRTSLLNSVVPLLPSRGRIEFTNVAFAYPNRPQQLILDGFSLTVAPGECVALVGGSGSGKSSTVALLEKFYDYHAGQVTLDGQDLRLVEANWVRSQIGLVSQEPILFSCSIADNIRYGDNSRQVPMEQVVEAARAANIHDFIMSLPDQYDTQLSGTCGSGLSGGQRQRIAIARAFVRRAPILILDEATSALDTENESYVQETLRRSRKGRTSLIIAHRLSNIKDADKIVVMRNGRIVEIGTHFELLRKVRGRYRSLWQRQEAQNWSSAD